MSLTKPDFDVQGAVTPKPVVWAVSVEGVRRWKLGMWGEPLDPSIKASLILFQEVQLPHTYLAVLKTAGKRHVEIKHNSDPTKNFHI